MLKDGILNSIDGEMLTSTLNNLGLNADHLKMKLKDIADAPDEAQEAEEATEEAAQTDAAKDEELSSKSDEDPEVTTENV